MGIDLSKPLTLDLRNVDQPAPEGWHTVEIERATPGLSKRSGDAKIFILARDRCADCEYNSQTIIWNVMLEGAGLPFTRRFLDAAGYGVDEKMDFESVQALADSMVGREVQVHVVHSEDAPSGYNVNQYRPAGTEMAQSKIAW